MKYFILTMDGSYRETGNQVPGFGGVSAEKEFRLDQFIETVERIIAKRSVQYVLVVRGPRFSAPPFGALEEIHKQLQLLVKAGKKTWYYAPDYGMKDIYLSSACSIRCIHPLGQASFRGLARTGLFFQGILEKHDIRVDVIRRGRYKSAADPFRGTAFDDFDREQWQRLLDAVVEEFTDTVIQQRGISRDLLDRMLAGEVFTAAESEKNGLIEEIRIPGDITGQWKKEKVKQFKGKKYRGGFGRGRQVTAVLFHEGAIDEGRSRMSPLIGQVIGDEVMVREIDRLKDSRRVKAVVFRISSGGGSAVASENILKALAALAEKKPLVVSMGPVAGSGGYWIAGAGRRLFCGATTVTGSIGVISMFFELQDLLASKGITADTIRKGDHADIGSSLRPMSADEHSMLDKQIEDIYQEFLRRTSEIRGMKLEDVKSLAEGRVWIGSDAKEKGLTDQVGTLGDAVSWVRKEAGISSAKVSFYPRIKVPLVQKLLTPKPAALMDSSLPLQHLVQECRNLNGRSMLLDYYWYTGRDLY